MSISINEYYIRNDHKLEIFRIIRLKISSLSFKPENEFLESTSLFFYFNEIQ